MNIHEELLNAAKTAGFEGRKPGQSRDEYIKELVLIVGLKVDAKVWDGLSQEAQTYYNLAGEAINTWVGQTHNPANPAEKAIPHLPGLDDAEAPAATTTAAAEPVHHAPAVPIKGPETGRVSAAAPNPANTPKAATGEKKSVTNTTRSIVVAHMDWNNDQIKAELVKQGYAEADLKISSISTIRTDALNTLNEALRQGWKKP